MKEILKEMSHEILTQDNRITNHPVFEVQEKERTYGLEPGWSEHFEWLNDEGTVCNKSDDGAIKVYYSEKWRMVQPFFTMKAAEEYIRENKHNMKEPRVYVASGYRNKEWQAIREFLKTLGDQCE
jgi:hypothetical protein